MRIVYNLILGIIRLATILLSSKEVNKATVNVMSEKDTKRVVYVQRRRYMCTHVMQ